MAEPWPAGAALRAALRRVTSRIVVIVGGRRVPVGDIVTPLVAALEDETIAIAGSAGLVSADLWHLEPGGFGEVTVVTADCYAFRRQDALERGEVDDRLTSPAGVAAWLSLVLRDAGTSVPPRLALAIELPLPPLPPLPTVPDGEQPPLARRDRYRLAGTLQGSHRPGPAGRDDLLEQSDGADRDHDGDAHDQERDTRETQQVARANAAGRLRSVSSSPRRPGPVGSRTRPAGSSRGAPSRSPARPRRRGPRCARRCRYWGPRSR